MKMVNAQLIIFIVQETNNSKNMSIGDQELLGAVCEGVCVFCDNHTELEEKCMKFLKLILRLSRGKYGYVACNNLLEPSKMKYTASVGMDMYIKREDVRKYNPNNTFLTPAHLRETWITIPLTFDGQICGLVGFENASQLSHSDLKKTINPLTPQLMSKMVGSLLNSKNTNVQQNLFLSTMSHEIRTPLNGIVGMSRILKESAGLSEDQKSYVNVIGSCTQQLLELVNDILDFSKMDCNQLSLEPDIFDVKAAMDELYDLVYLKLQEKKLSMFYSVHESVPSFLFGDKKRIRQIILNLVNNSIKYTDSGKITVELRCEGSVDLHVRVMDTGIGIKTQDSIFKSFQQIRNQHPTAEGVGLGLAICKQLCKLMNGDIEVEFTEVSKGTCIHFYVHLDPVPQHFAILKERQAYMELLNGKSVLLVDSDMIRRLTLLDGLVQLGMKPYVCATPDEAFHYLRFNTIDITVALTENIPSIVHLLHERSIPYVTLVRDPDPTTEHTLNVESGFDQSLLVALSVAMKNANTTQFKSHTISENNIPTQLDILIVEDNAHNMFVISETLKKLGYNMKSVEKASTGAEAIQKAIARQFDVILMDLLLPTVDGFSATSQILKYYRNRCPKHLRSSLDKFDSLLPTIIALTAMVTQDTKQRCTALGFKGFLSKPLEKDELETMLTIVAKRRAMSRQRLSSTANSPSGNNQ